MHKPFTLPEPDSERMLLIGRLAPGIVHEISNPVQAIHGAATLGLEEIDDQQALIEYLRLCLNESERIIALLNLIRQIYRPDSEDSEQVDLNHELQGSLLLARDEIHHSGIETRLVFADHLDPIVTVKSQIFITNLMILLSIVDAIHAVDGQLLQIQTQSDEEKVTVTFSTDAAVSWFEATGSGERTFIQGSEWMEDILAANQGRLEFSRQEQVAFARLSFPRINSAAR